MRSYVDLATLANLVAMLRADIDGAIWLVDDDEEARFYERCAHEKARVIPAPHVALQLLSRVQNRGTAGVVAAVRDGSIEELDSDVFHPGLGDVASLLLASGCCRRVLEDIVGGSWYRACEKEVGPLRDRAITVAWELGTVGRVNGRRFEGPAPIDQLIDWEKLELSTLAVEQFWGPKSASDLIEIRSRGIRLAVEEMLKTFDGMEAVRIAAASTKLYKPRGIQANSEVSADRMISMLRVAFDLGDLDRDEIFWQMKRWERQNPKFPLLRLWRLLDPLDVVWDQRYWEQDLSYIVGTSQQGAVISAIKMDLDNFKDVNEALGHTGGDEAIRLYCKLVRDLLSPIGYVYRRGGDEVVVLAPDLAGIEAVAHAERLREAIEKQFLDWGQSRGLNFPPTASIGVVEVATGTPLNEVVRVMDEAQQRAKTEGKNRVVFVKSGHCYL